MKYFLFIFIFISFFLQAEDEIRVLHNKIVKAEVGQEIEIKVNLINAYKVNYLILHYKNFNEQVWSQTEMIPEQGVFLGKIPADVVNENGVVYYIEVIDIKGTSIKGFADKKNPQYIDIIMKKNGGGVYW